MTSWVESALFYHLYPLGFFGCEQYAIKEVHHRILSLTDWIDHFKSLHINALYLGPVFSSYEHGYDTSDYQLIDPRLGTNEDFKEVCKKLKEAGIHIVLDGVFNHVGRDFWAFQDVLQNQEQSIYKDWFHINFHPSSSWNDPFTYETWEGHPNLIKLNVKNEEVVQYLLSSINMWIDEFQIDGLRLDAADCIEPEFFKRLKKFCKEKKEDFWLMGEIIHGDYNRWANDDMLDSVTNYECYKGLYSSHNEKNYFEIAYSLNRQFGEGGLYKKLLLYNFVDNHDVNRLASTIKQEQDLFNIYTMMYTMPGIPSIYYGSEYAMKGIKHDGSDADIRPCLIKQKDIPLTKHLQKLGKLYEQYEVLQHGSYQQILVKNEQFVFLRSWSSQSLYAAFNVSDEAVTITFPFCESQANELLENLPFTLIDNLLETELPPHSAALFINEQAKEKKQKIIKEVDDQPIQLGHYRHFKGKEYVVLYLAKHSETLEDYVVYRQLYGDEEVWVRPASMFKETVEKDGKTQPRFTYLGS